ncbi:hypothetical protein [Azotobacter vinelandii]|uniref:hypothetical protein n=1 Tax=Azotobacter vinelandii TaxID=354 RepID=UPI000AA944EC|nr:hypothetical protein [Azotobacter vinelandii]WKN21215.1 hypothetical protein AVAEIV_004294 [Azotobacter vinelandii]
MKMIGPFLFGTKKPRINLAVYVFSSMAILDNLSKSPGVQAAFCWLLRGAFQRNISMRVYLSNLPLTTISLFLMKVVDPIVVPPAMAGPWGSPVRTLGASG